VSNQDINVSGTRKRIRTPEFKDWVQMHALPSDDQLWIYFSPNNREAALVSHRTGEILYITDRATGVKLYESPNIRKEIRARAFRPPRII
jgi:hypothetical protein